MKETCATGDREKQIMEMELTDEQINQAIHEKVMGKCWHKIIGNGRGGFAECVKCGEAAKYYLLTNREVFEDIRFDENTEYTDSISGAFQVVAKFESEGWCWTLTNTADYEPSRFHKFAEIWRGGKSHGLHQAESLPKAICLAALQATEEKR